MKTNHTLYVDYKMASQIVQLQRNVKSTISTILKNKDEINVLSENNSLKIKPLRISEDKVEEETLLTSFKHNMANNVPISEPTLQQKTTTSLILWGRKISCVRRLR